ncbi:MAG TPA: ABC transporter permease [Acidiferrobacter sp.]|nr:ABC transporter permease [Acidiferrobacter sp.]
MERFRLLYALAWRNLWRNARRTSLVLLAVAFGMWSILSFTALLQGWGASTLTAALKNMTSQGQIHARGYLDDPGAMHRLPPAKGRLAALLNGPAVRQWGPRIAVPAAIQSAYQTMPVSLIGIDPVRERGLSFITTAVHDGRNLANKNARGILLGHKLAQRLHARIGQRIVVMSQGANGALAERGMRVIGLFSATPQVEEREVFISLRQAQALLGMGHDITGIAFDLHDINGLGSFIHRLRLAAPNRDIQSWDTLRPMTKAMTEFSGAFINIWIVIMFVLMAFGIVNTLLMSLHERVRELALFEALGLRPQLVLAQVTLESALVILLGIVSGTALAGVTVLAFHGGLDLGFLARGAEWFGAGRVLFLHLRLSQALRIGGLVWALGVTAGLIPTWRMVRRVPIDVINRSPT